MVDKIDINCDPNDTDKIFNFIKDIFIGIEMKIFAMIDDKKEFKEKITTSEAMHIGVSLIEYYLNQLYRKLLEKDDELIVNKFNEFTNILNDNPVIILNLISNVIMKCYPLFPRSKLNIENLEKYILSVNENTDKMKKYIITMFNGDLNKLKEEKDRESNKKVEKVI
jgi:hypothetical protein